MEGLLAPYIPTPKEAYRKILELGKLKPGEIFYEIGAGLFGLGITACKSPYDAKSIGIELREYLVKIADRRIKRGGLEDKAKIIHKDFLSPEIDVSDADLVYVFLSERGTAMIRSKLEKQLKGKARVVSKEYYIPKWVYSSCRVARAPVVISGITTPPIQHYFMLYKMNEIRKR